MSGSELRVDGQAPCHRSGLNVDDVTKAIHTPVSRLSDDILLLMLEGAVSIGEDELLGDTMWNLTAVCIRWRKLAISCAALWSSVELVLLDGPEFEPTNVDEQTALLRCRRALIQLDRAKNHPLACHMDLPICDESAFEHHFVLSAVRQILAQLHRCTRISIYGGPPTWDLFSSRPPPRFTLLRRLHYVRDRFNYYQDQLPPFFEDTPVLEHLVLMSCGTPPPFPPSWKTLATLELTRCRRRLTSRELIDLLSFTENLVKLSIGGVAWIGSTIPINGQDHPTGDAVLPQLSELVVHCYPEPDWRNEYLNFDLELISSIPIAIRHLRCPNLTAVHIHDPLVLPWTPNEIREVLTCVLSSGNPSSVRSITFDWGRDHKLIFYDRFISDSIIDLLSQLPCLEHIRIQDTEKTWFNKVLDALRSFKLLIHPDRDPDEPSSSPGEAQFSSQVARQLRLCPQLSRVEFVRCYSVDYDTLLNVILRRSASALRHVVLEDLRFINEGLYKCPMKEVDQLLRYEPGIERLETLQIT